MDSGNPYIAAIANVVAAQSTMGLSAAARDAQGKTAAVQAKAEGYSEGAQDTANAMAASDKAMAEDEAAKNQARDTARKRQEQRSRRSQGRAGTLLTGPLGLSNEPEVSRKTILGG